MSKILIDEATVNLALEALESCGWNDGYAGENQYFHDDLVDKAITALREARAEQPALLAANKDLQNHFDALMNDYKKLSALCSSQGTRLMEYESSHEPESKPWVGLTRDERMSIINRLIGQDWVYALDAIEAKLKEKNA